MKEFRALTPEQFERAAAKLRNPAAGSRIEAAKEFGIDLSLLIEQLRLTPAERGARLREASRVLGPLLGFSPRAALVEFETSIQALCDAENMLCGSIARATLRLRLGAGEAPSP